MFGTKPFPRALILGLMPASVLVILHGRGIASTPGIAWVFAITLPVAILISSVERWLALATKNECKPLPGALQIDCAVLELEAAKRLRSAASAPSKHPGDQ